MKRQFTGGRFLGIHRYFASIVMKAPSSLVFLVGALLKLLKKLTTTVFRFSKIEDLTLQTAIFFEILHLHCRGVLEAFETYQKPAIMVI